MTKVQRKENSGYQIPYRQTHTEEGEEAVEECSSVGECLLVMEAPGFKLQ